MLSVVSAPKKREGGSLEGVLAPPASDEDDDLDISGRSIGRETLEADSLVDLDESSDDELAGGLP